MAFSTEFVMGAGGGVEEIPVSMSGGGDGTVYPLTTVDAGDGALIVVTGTLDTVSTNISNRPYLTIGTYTHEHPYPILNGPLPGGLIGGRFSGTVQIDILSRFTSTTTFTGTVYVVRD